MKTFSLWLLLASLAAAPAQTNAVFQDCHPGDAVRVSCLRPLLALSKATLMEIGSNTVTVCTSEDRFVLAQSQVTLVPLPAPQPPAEIGLPSDAANSSSPLVGPSPTSSSAMASAPPAASFASAIGFSAGASRNNDQDLMAQVRAAVIGAHQEDAFKEPKMVNGRWELAYDPHSPGGQARVDQANLYYDQTMAGVMNGTVTQNDLVQQAKAELQQIDQLKKDGVNVSQYDREIKILREFVRRSEAGEKFNFATGPVQ